MNSPKHGGWPTLVAGCGSSHGDDRTGWRLAKLLRRKRHVPARVLAICDPVQLIEELTGCRRLIIVDACCHGKEPGSVVRCRWPDLRLIERHSHSTHCMRVGDVLRLADRLGRLPPQVEIYGVEVADCSPASEISPAVAYAVEGLAEHILEELREVAYA